MGQNCVAYMDSGLCIVKFDRGIISTEITNLSSYEKITKVRLRNMKLLNPEIMGVVITPGIELLLYPNGKYSGTMKTNVGTRKVHGTYEIVSQL